MNEFIPMKKAVITNQQDIMRMSIIRKKKYGLRRYDKESYAVRLDNNDFYLQNQDKNKEGYPIGHETRY